MPPFSTDDAAIAAINNTTFLEIEAKDFLARPAPLCSRRRSSSASTLNSAVSVEHFPISPIPERTVSFHPYGELIEIDTLDEYSDEEIEACWYSEDEIEAARKEIQDTVRRLTRGPRRADDCPRGLESQLPSFHPSSRRLRSDSIMAVLSEQFKQRQIGGVERPERLREVYILAANPCLGRAIESARHDAWDAYRAHQEQPTSKDEDEEEMGTVEKKKCWIFDISTWFPRIAKSALVDC